MSYLVSWRLSSNGLIKYTGRAKEILTAGKTIGRDSPLPKGQV